MVKGLKVGRPAFDKVFASVNSFHSLVDYSQVNVLGDVYAADEDHDGKLILRVRRQIPNGVSPVNLACLQPWQRDMSIGKAMSLAMEYGPRPATHFETRSALLKAIPEQIQALFDRADRTTYESGIKQKPMALSIICLATAVAGESSELITELEVVRGCGRPCRTHLRKIDFDAPLYPAQMLSFVSPQA